MPGFLVHHQLPEPTQIHVHWVDDAIQPSHPLLSPSPPTFSPSQHLGLFKWVSSSHQVAKVLKFQLQRHSPQWILGLISIRMVWQDLLAVQGTLKSLLYHHSSKASILQCSVFFIVQLSHPYITQDRRVMVKSSDKMWSTGEENSKPLQYSCIENPMNSIKRQKVRTLKDELFRSVGAQYVTGDQWRNNSRRNEETEPKQKQHSVVTGNGSKVQCCKEQYCIGTWNVRSMNQGKSDMVKQEMARGNIDILGISELKWTGMGEFNSDDHYIYYCGQESLEEIE